MSEDKDILNLLNKGYFRDGETTWEDICKRVSNGIANAEEDHDLWANTFYDMMAAKIFIPSTPCLVNADETNKGQLSSCFIISVDDTLDSIYDTRKECAIIFQKNGGVGFNISALRPRNSDVMTSGGKSGGAVSWLKGFDVTATETTENNLRKGAIKIDLNDWHPDVIEFISCKDTDGLYEHMNISVSLSDAFMHAVENDEDWNLRFPDYKACKEIYDKEWHGDIEDWEEKGYPVVIYKTLKARDLYNTIMSHAWQTGEPGVSFRDVMNSRNNNPHIGKIVSSNPCAEFVSIPFSSCNLGSVNMTKFVGYNAGDKNGVFDFDVFRYYVRNAIRFIDDMITVNKLPTKRLEEMTKKTRPIGLGTMGFSDCLFMLGIPYGSQECIDFIDDVYNILYKTAVDESSKLAEERGTYELWKGSLWDQKGIKMRNSNLISIAPNGSIAFIADKITGGIEPCYALVYTRRTNNGTEYNVVNPYFEDALRKAGIYSEKILSKVVENNGSCQKIEEIPEEIRRVFVTAGDLSSDIHVNVLAEVQKFVDLSISKTINFPNDASVSDIYDAYMNAWKLGCKGVTVYRDGSRKNQTLSVRKKDVSGSETKERGELRRGDMILPSDDSASFTKSITTGCGKIKVEYHYDEKTGEPVEVWLNPYGHGGCERNIQFISRLISGLIQCGAPLDYIIDQGKSVRECSSFMSKKGTSKGRCCPSAIAYTLEELQKKVHAGKCSDDVKEIKYEIVQPEENEEEAELGYCPLCGEPLRDVQGCIGCSCGWNKCNSPQPQ